MIMRNLPENKTRNKRGFTLAETLLAVLILLMVSVIVATGIPAAKSAYEKVVLASNAEVLLSTTMSSLRNELGTASDVIRNADNSLTYYNGTRGATSKIYKADSSPNVIMIQRYVNAGDPVRLVSEKAATADLYVTYDSVSYENGIITFNNLSVNRESGSTGIAKRDTYSIRVISE